VTYRIGRLRHGEYEVVRILDDVRIGTFECSPNLTVTSSSIHPAFILSIARAASARPSWVRRMAHALRGRSGSGTMKKVGADAREPSEAEQDIGIESGAEGPTLQKKEEKG
jgi:hypothetical protein